MITERQTGTTELLSELRNGALILTLNRPEARNAMSIAMLRALQAELSYAQSAPDVRCIVLRGSDKAFCAGGDVKGMGAVPGGVPIDEQIHFQRRVQRETAGALAKLPKPTLAVINGPAAGAGLSLALACDLRLIASTAFLVTSFASVGLSGDFGVSYFLAHMVGSAKARELMFLSDRVSAAEAVSLGLANWSCEPHDLAERADALAARLAAAPTTALGYMKENINRAFRAEIDECMDLEATHHIHCMGTADHREGVAAFVEKRAPRFANR